jgi:hypothetical protein
MKTLADITRVTATLPPRILIHGKEGVGKTTLASRFPAPVFLQTEDGAPAGVEIPSFGLLDDYSDVRAAITALGGEQHDFETLVLDSLDRLEPLVWRAVCAANGWPSIETPGYGKGYVEADRFWADALAGFDWLRRQRGMTILILAHSAAQEVADPRAPSYTSYELRVHRRARGLVADWCDAIGFLATDVVVHSEEQGFNRRRARAEGGSTRWLHWEARPAFTAKNRYGLPAKMQCPLDFDFDKLGSFFPPATRRDATYSPRRVATPERE